MKQELGHLKKATASIVFILWGVFPIHVLGWLVSAISRHQVAWKELENEPSYRFVLLWMGGANFLPISTLLIMLFLLGITVSELLKKGGFAEKIDRMERGRFFVKRFLIPSFLSSAGFVTGLFSGANLTSFIGSSLMLSVFALFAGFTHYIVDTSANYKLDLAVNNAPDSESH